MQQQRPARRILVIDESPVVLITLQTALGDLYDVHTAQGAEEGRRRLAQGPYTLLLVDIACVALLRGIGGDIGVDIGVGLGRGLDGGSGAAPLVLLGRGREAQRQAERLRAPLLRKPLSLAALQQLLDQLLGPDEAAA